MPYSEKLAERIRALCSLNKNYTEKKMFGGLAFSVHGHMSITVSAQGGILVRVDPTQYDAYCLEPNVETAVMRGKKMKGWLRVSEDALRTNKQLKRWFDLSQSYAKSLEPK